MLDTVCHEIFAFQEVTKNCAVNNVVKFKLQQSILSLQTPADPQVASAERLIDAEAKAGSPSARSLSRVADPLCL